LDAAVSRMQLVTGKYVICCGALAHMVSAPVYWMMYATTPVCCTLRVASGADAENTYEDEPLTHFLVVKGSTPRDFVQALSLYEVWEMVPEVSAVYITYDVEEIIVHPFN
jgi:hypothetical protein